MKSRINEIGNKNREMESVAAQTLVQSKIDLILRTLKEKPSYVPSSTSIEQPDYFHQTTDKRKVSVVGGNFSDKACILIEVTGLIR